jgi:mutator protein MutT
MTLPTEQPTLVGIGLIRRGDRFLIRQRPAGTVYAGYWEFPGGKCEPGEPPAAATVRECLEETGMAVTLMAERHVTTHRYPHGLVELHFYDCAPESEDAEPLEGSGFRWVGARELGSLRFPEANQAILEQIARAHVRGPDSG